MSDAGATHGSSRHEQVVQHESEVAPFRVYAKQGEGGREGGTDGTDGDRGPDGGRRGVEGVIGAHFGEPLAERGFAKGVDHRVEKVETSPITDMAVQKMGVRRGRKSVRVFLKTYGKRRWEEGVGPSRRVCCESRIELHSPNWVVGPNESRGSAERTVLVTRGETERVWLG